MDNIPWMFRIAKMQVYFEMAKEKRRFFVSPLLMSH